MGGNYCSEDVESRHSHVGKKVTFTNSISFLYNYYNAYLTVLNSLFILLFELFRSPVISTVPCVKRVESCFLYINIT